MYMEKYQLRSSMDVLTCDIGTEIYKIKYTTFGCSSVSKYYNMCLLIEMVDLFSLYHYIMVQVLSRR